MSIGDRLRRWRDLARLRRAIRVAPSPAAWAELSERLIAWGHVDDALEAAEAGLRTFPDAERLAQVRAYALRGRHADELRALRLEVQRRPTPAGYVKLAELQRRLGENEDALATAQECADRFPLGDGAFLLQGEVRFERFLADVLARDAVLAESALRRAARIRSQDVRAPLLLAELCWLVGDLPGCRSALRTVLAVQPAAREIQAFLREIGAAGDGGADDDAAAASFADLAEKVEQSGDFANDPARFPTRTAQRPCATRRRGALDVDTLRARVTALAARDGVRNTIVLDREGAVLTDAGDDGLTRRQFSDLVRTIAATADDASRRMDAGSLVRAEVETPAGRIMVTRARELTVGLLYGDPLRPDLAWEELQDAVARSRHREAQRA